MKNTAANKFTIKYKKQYQMLQSRRKKKQIRQMIGTKH